MSARVRITYWSDPLCIWAYLAHDKLQRLRQRFGADIAIEHRIVPVFGSVPERFRSGAWSKGGPKSRASRTAEIAKAHGHPEVDGACWLRDAPASSWSPASAIKAVDLLAQEGAIAPDAPGDFTQALRAAFFCDHLNIARRDVQQRVAEALTLPWPRIQARLDDGRALAALWEDHAEREARRVQGSPTWSFDDGRAMLYGNVSERVLQATVAELLGGTSPGGSACT